MKGNKRRKHGKHHVKKRRKIDLQAISKKVNERKTGGAKKIYAGSHGTPSANESYDTKGNQADAADEEGYSSESSIEQEPSAYEQLLSTLGSSAANQYSDEEDDVSDEDEDEEEFDEEDIDEEDAESDIIEDEDEDSTQISLDKKSGRQLEENVEVEDEEDEDEDGDNEEEEEVASDEEEEEVASDEEEEEVASDEEDGNKDEEEVNTETQLKDPFLRRMAYDIGSETASELAKGEVTHKFQTKWNTLRKLVFSSMCSKKPVVLRAPQSPTFNDLNIRKRIWSQWVDSNQQFIPPQSNHVFTPLQLELFTIINAYQDLLFTEKTHKNAEEIRNVTCLHILNHIVKSRDAVLKHNTMLTKDPTLDTETMRDQGLTRPGVLIVVPFRDGALRIVNTLINVLLPADSQNLGRRKRFNDEYGELVPVPNKYPMPEDWESTFAGNNDDHFRIGLSITRKRLQLYTEFYKSDIIIASPLGLRTLIGTKGEKHQDYDFLSSIELLVLDQADVFLMQNWEHIIHLMEYLHLQPRDSHGVDFSRLREWTLNGWSKYYRQTLILSSVTTPEINSLFNKHCANFEGKVMVYNPPVTGSICQVITQLPQVFHRLQCQNFTEDSDQRFEFFLSKVFPQYQDPGMLGTMIYIPQYFDYVRLRNYFRKKEIRIAQICEYTSQPNISRARLYIADGSRHILLYTERFHFFRRYKLKGIRNIVFYQLPTYPKFYSEICNMVESRQTTVEHNCSIVYTRYDAQKLAGVVGSSRCGHMLSSDKDTYMLVTGADS
ncbi:digestive organ expansion factor homolog isoform X2 [Asterias rubens]|uniref:digestive organ expansion factor homolog isoform X2 n=1 Tax=Asterias rubens TaxID=7604 RepID=UPI001455A9DE|nr:digestive organ expansion factor homolog isoform X2 [Asterias rubens]